LDKASAVGEPEKKSASTANAANLFELMRKSYYLNLKLKVQVNQKVIKINVHKTAGE
jgi:hypothetical protein